MIIQPQSTSCPPAVPAYAPTPACTPRCFGYRDLLDGTALPMQSPAVARSRPLTVCGSVTVCASVIVQDIRCFGYRNPALETFSPSWQSLAVASPGPDDACAQSTSPLCCAVISCKGLAQTKIGRVSAFSHTRIYSPFPLWTLALRHYSNKHHHNQQQPLHHHQPLLWESWSAGLGRPSEMAVLLHEVSA